MRKFCCAEIGDGSVIVDLSVSETKPLTSYGSGEDEEAGSGEEYDQYKEAEDVPTSMQNDKAVAAGIGTLSKSNFFVTKK